MRTLPIALGILTATSFLIASAPSSTAAAYCVDGVANTYPDDPCGGVACVGQDQDGWMVCVPGVCTTMDCAPLWCQFQSDCCQAFPGGSPFHCPDTE